MFNNICLNRQPFWSDVWILKSAKFPRRSSHCWKIQVWALGFPFPTQAPSGKEQVVHVGPTRFTEKVNFLARLETKEKPTPVSPSQRVLGAPTERETLHDLA